MGEAAGAAEGLNLNSAFFRVPEGEITGVSKDRAKDAAALRATDTGSSIEQTSTAEEKRRESEAREITPGKQRELVTQHDNSALEGGDIGSNTKAEQKEIEAKPVVVAGVDYTPPETQQELEQQKRQEAAVKKEPLGFEQAQAIFKKNGGIKLSGNIRLADDGRGAKCGRNEGKENTLDTNPNKPTKEETAPDITPVTDKALAAQRENMTVLGNRSM